MTDLIQPKFQGKLDVPRKPSVRIRSANRHSSGDYRLPRAISVRGLRIACKIMPFTAFRRAFSILHPIAMSSRTAAADCRPEHNILRCFTVGHLRDGSSVRKALVAQNVLMSSAFSNGRMGTGH